jgi:hypothetical protein
LAQASGRSADACGRQLRANVVGRPAELHRERIAVRADRIQRLLGDGHRRANV